MRYLVLIGSSQRTCKFWLSNLWQSRQALTLSTSHAIWLPHIVDRLSRLISLTLYSPPAWLPVDFFRILRIPCLQRLIMSRSHWYGLDHVLVDDTPLVNGPQLSFLQLNSGKKFQSKHLAWFAPFSASLTHLDVSNHLKLRDDGLSEQLSRFTSLRELNLAGCLLLSDESLGWDLASKLHAVEMLDISNTKAGDATVASWLRMNPKLTHLSAGRTGQTFHSLVSLGKFGYNLSYLDLQGHSTLVDHFVQHLSHLTVLRTLNMSSCVGLTGKSVIETIMDLTTLVNLRINRFRVDDYELSHLSRLTRLQTLTVANCFQIDGSALDPLSTSLNCLQHLDLSGCELEPHWLNHLTKWAPTLRVLNLALCRIQDETVPSLGALTNLTNLDLSRSELTDHAIPYLVQLSRLSTLSLAHTEQLTDIGLMELNKLSAITQLDLSWNPEITDQGVYELLKLPAIQFMDLAYCASVSGKCLEDVFNAGINIVTFSD